MPTVSAKQARAMFAAKAGKSKIGIPQKVGAEFIAADRKKSRQLAHRSRRKRKAQTSVLRRA